MCRRRRHRRCGRADRAGCRYGGTWESRGDDRALDHCAGGARPSAGSRCDPGHASGDACPDGIVPCLVQRLGSVALGRDRDEGQGHQGSCGAQACDGRFEGRFGVRRLGLFGRRSLGFVER